MIEGPPYMLALDGERTDEPLPADPVLAGQLRWLIGQLLEGRYLPRTIVDELRAASRPDERPPILNRYFEFLGRRIPHSAMRVRVRGKLVSPRGYVGAHRDALIRHHRQTPEVEREQQAPEVELTGGRQMQLARRALGLSDHITAGLWVNLPAALRDLYAHDPRGYALRFTLDDVSGLDKLPKNARARIEQALGSVRQRARELVKERTGNANDPDAHPIGRRRKK